MKALRGPALLLLAITIAGLACAVRKPQTPTRIFLITIDTLRADHLGTYGYKRPTTPFLDQLAEEAVVFDEAYSPISHTAPAHASLFTGLYPAQHGLLVNGQRLDERWSTLAGRLQLRGYRTAAFATASFLKVLGSGFEHFEALPQRPADQVFARCLRWLDELESAAPDGTAGHGIFAWVHLFDVHQWHDPAAIDEGAARAMRKSGLRGDSLLDEIESTQGPIQWDRTEALQAINAYDGQIASTDAALRDFVAALRERGLLESSVLVLTADHGEGLGHHRHLGHGASIYQEQLRVPLVVLAPDGRFQARRVPEPVRLVDLSPTLLQLVGEELEQPGATVVGQSLVPLLEGRERSTPATVFFQRRPPDGERLRAGWEPGAEWHALRVGRWKVARRTGADPELYDLENDPFELRSIFDAELEQHAELLERLDALSQELRREGAGVAAGAIDESFVEELRALGYL